MFQEVNIIGHLGGDPEMRYLDSGTPVTSFSVATNRTWNDSDGNKQEETTWFRVSVFARMAEVCNEYLAKGRPVFVQGTLRSVDGGPRVWEGDDGIARASYELRARTVKFLGGRQEGAEPREVKAPETEDDEIPF